MGPSSPRGSVSGCRTYQQPTESAHHPNARAPTKLPFAAECWSSPLPSTTLSSQWQRRMRNVRFRRINFFLAGCAVLAAWLCAARELPPQAFFIARHTWPSKGPRQRLFTSLPLSTRRGCSGHGTFQHQIRSPHLSGSATVEPQALSSVLDGEAVGVCAHRHKPPHCHGWGRAFSGPPPLQSFCVTAWAHAAL